MTNTYSCPACEDDVEVPLPLAKYVTCESCKTKLEINVDADFEDGHWHDLTTLSVVDPDREHKERMLHGWMDSDNVTAPMNNGDDS